MVDDPDPLVRYQLAFSLGGRRDDARDALAALAIRDGENPGCGWRFSAR